MIHSAKFGSIERFFGVLVEHYAGAFPPWLAPVQAVGIPISERHVDYLYEVAARLRVTGCGGGRRVGRPDAEEGPQRAAAEGAVHADRRRRRRRGRSGVASATATAARTTAWRSDAASAIVEAIESRTQV
jgi:threonyl-tRNA synthetase